MTKNRPKLKIFSAAFFLFLVTTLPSRLDAQDLNLDSNGAQPDYVTDQFGKIQTQLKPQDVIHWDFVDSKVNSDKSLELNLRLRTEKNFTIYNDKLEFQPPVGWIVKDMKFPPTTKILDPISKKNVEVFAGGEFMLTLTGDISNQDSFELGIRYVGCTRVICLFPFTEKITVKLSAQSSSVSPAPAEIVNEEKPLQKSESIDSRLSSYFSELLGGQNSLWLILMVALLGGILTNLTPCVAPMIPITIRILSGQSKKPVRNAIIYSLGLMFTYTTLGLLAAYTASLFGSFIANPYVSLGFAGFMFLFAVTMMGYGDLSKMQMLGSKIGGGKEHLLNTFLMGTAAGLVAAPCTGPILASILAFAAGRQNLKEAVALMVTYSFGFALPYVILGTFSQQFARLKISAFWQKLTKILFAAVMFALSFYYARVAIYGVYNIAKPYFLHIMITALLVGCAGIFLSFSRPYSRFIGLISSLFLGLGLFCLSQIVTTASNNLTWIRSEKEALQIAKNQNKPILMDSWAEWCEACKKMEKTTFSDAEVVKILQDDWVLGKIDLTTQDSSAEAFQKHYDIIGLPTLILLPESGQTDRKILITGFVDAPELLKKLKSAKSQWLSETAKP